MAILLELVETTGVWPQGLLDAFFAMIPKADGDSTPLGQKPLSVLPAVYWLWASLRGGCLSQLKVWVVVSLQLKLGLPLLWTLRRFCPVACYGC